MNILFLSRWFPYPISNGSRLRIYNLLRGLSQHHTVTLLSFSDQPEANPEVPELRQFCSEVHAVPWKEYNPASRSARLGFLSLTPRSIIDTFSEEMASQITKLVSSSKYDLVIASQLSMAAYHQYFQHCPAIFEELELGLPYENFLRAPTWTKKLRHGITWFKLRTYLKRLLNSFRAVTVVSEQEQALAKKFFPAVAQIHVIPNCIDLDEYRELQTRPRLNTLVFTGPFRYHANYEAMQWFVGQVFPLILRQVPAAELIITGDHANLPLPSIKNVSLAGYVSDIKGLVASATVALAPLRSGGGTRLKILEAMAIGTPVVATSKGAEGLDAQHGEHFYVADDPAEFATYVVKLLRDKDLRRSMAGKASLLVQKKYDWERVYPQLEELVECNSADQPGV